MICFSPLAGIMLAETYTGEFPNNISINFGFSPLAGIMLAETLEEGLRRCRNKAIEVSVPLRGLCWRKLYQFKAPENYKGSFSPLAGIMLAETLKNEALIFKKQFQSPCGDYVGGNFFPSQIALQVDVSVPLRGLCWRKRLGPCRP